MKNIVLSIALFAVVLAFAALSAIQTAPQVTASDEYCEMVSLWHSTGGTKTTPGEYGWPDYRGIYEEACK